MRDFPTPLGDRQAAADEAHHRMANSFQLIGSLVTRRVRHTTSAEVRAELLSIGSAVAAMQSAYRHLYVRQTETIELSEYLRDLVTSVATYAPLVSTVAVRFDENLTDPVFIGEQTAISIGLVVSELLTNSIKYAGPAAACKASIALDGRGLIIEVSDNGPGFARTPSEGSGLKIVTALVSSFGGTLSYTSDTAGPRFSIRLPMASSVAHVNAMIAGM